MAHPYYSENSYGAQDTAESFRLGDVDVWEFTHCDHCMVSFEESSSGQSRVPFWLTACGHVLCNSHISTGRTCTKCGATNVDVFPLQKDLPEPMASWFKPAASTLDSVAQTIRFQHAAIAAEARHYKARCVQYHNILLQANERHKEFKDLQHANECLRREVAQLRAQLRSEETHYTNGNGKRIRLQSGGTTPTVVDDSMSTHTWDMGDDRRSATSHANSSPFGRIDPTSMRPNRLTLPADQPQPNFLPAPPVHQPVPQRPVASLQQFAYTPPTPNRATNDRYDNVVSPMTTKSQRMMPPPPVPASNRSRFIPNDTSTPRKLLPQPRATDFAVNHHPASIQQQAQGGPRANLTSLKTLSSSHAKEPPSDNSAPTPTRTDRLPAFRPASTASVARLKSSFPVMTSHPSRTPLPHHLQHNPEGSSSRTSLFRPGTSSGNRLPFGRT